MADLDRVRAFLNSNHRSYVEVLDAVRGACDAVAARMGSSVVLRVYDRRDKQGGDPLKDAEKVMAAAEDLSAAALTKVSDIVGATVVVQYPDQTELFLDQLDRELSRKSFKAVKRKVHTSGYFATHAIYQSAKAEHGRALCEVQCKTVLHDAWSAKMHDLTYKPLGSLDPRLRGMVEAISTSLEGLELQSQIARDMVQSRHRGERKPFEAALRLFLQALEGAILAAPIDRAAALTELAPLRDEVRALMLNTSGRPTAEIVSSLSVRVLLALDKDETAEGAFLVAVRFASGLPEDQATRFLSSAADHLFDRLETLRTRGLVTEAGTRAIPTGFYLIQDFQRALEYADRLLDHGNALNLSDETVRILKFNKATWMLERESLRPSKPEKAATIKKVVDKLLGDVRANMPTNGAADLEDTDGLRMIVFGDSAAEVRAGLERCLDAGRPVDGDEVETALALAYAEWRNYTGWRRYFELAESEPEG